MVSQLARNDWKDGGKVETDGLETWKLPPKRPNISQQIKSKGVSQTFPWFPSKSQTSGRTEEKSKQTGSRLEDEGNGGNGEWIVVEGQPKRPNVSQKIKSKGVTQVFPWFPS